MKPLITESWIVSHCTQGPDLRAWPGDKLGEIDGAEGLDGNAHDSGHGKLHGLDGAGDGRGGDGSRLEEELVDTDGDGVTRRSRGSILELTIFTTRWMDLFSKWSFVEPGL